MKNNLDSKIAVIIKSRIGKLARIDPQLLDDNVHLVSDKVIDSLGIINLILDLEKQFSISFDEHDMLSDEFMTPKGLSLIVSDKIKKEK